MDLQDSGHFLGCLDSGHHLLLRDKMVDPLQQSEKALHVAAPLVEDVISIARFGKAHDPCWPIDLRVDGFGCDEFADVLFCLIGGEVEELRQTRHFDTGIVLCDHADIVFDDPLSQILPSLVCLGVIRLAWLRVEDVSTAEIGCELFCDHGPTHDFVEGEKS